jgi:hypothetical protein
LLPRPFRRRQGVRDAAGDTFEQRTLGSWRRAK